MTISMNLYSSGSPLNQSYQLSDSYCYNIINNNNKTFNTYLFLCETFFFNFLKTIAYHTAERQNGIFTCT